MRKNKDDKISKEFYFLGKIKAVGKPHQFTMYFNSNNILTK
ncbi:hypothetical protein FDF31_06730 [Clostridium sporogenes]|nr:hypothetical protein [Clostridium sporogenes]NFS25343.1 hypothetical protein [Clostridium sporogenes]